MRNWGDYFTKRRARQFGFVASCSLGLAMVGCGASTKKNSGHIPFGEAGGSAVSLPGAMVVESLPPGARLSDTLTCAGENRSPALTWPRGPAGTKSYAVIMTDETIHLIHWAIWDIPGGETTLPAGVSQIARPTNVPGATQAKSYDERTAGYLGPCPDGEEHTYSFSIYPLSVERLPGVTANSHRTVARAQILAHRLGEWTVSGVSDASAPRAELP